MCAIASIALYHNNKQLPPNLSSSLCSSSKLQKEESEKIFFCSNSLLDTWWWCTKTTEPLHLFVCCSMHFFPVLERISWHMSSGRSTCQSLAVQQYFVLLLWIRFFKHDALHFVGIQPALCGTIISTFHVYAYVSDFIIIFLAFLGHFISRKLWFSRNEPQQEYEKSAIVTDFSVCPTHTHIEVCNEYVFHVLKHNSSACSWKWWGKIFFLFSLKFLKRRMFYYLLISVYTLSTLELIFGFHPPLPPLDLLSPGVKWSEKSF